MIVRSLIAVVLVSLAQYSWAGFTISPDTVNFGFVHVNFPKTMNVQIKNEQDISQSLQVNYFSSPDLEIQNDCPDVLNPGEVCTIFLEFRPVFEVSLYTSLDVVGPTGKQRVQIRGRSFDNTPRSPQPFPLPRF